MVRFNKVFIVSIFSLQQVKSYGKKPPVPDNPSLNFLKYNFHPSEHTLDDGDATTWNKNVDKLAANKAVKESLALLNDLSGSIAQLKNILLKVVSSTTKAITREMVLKSVDDWLESDDKIETLLDLSVLELSLVIAIKHHSDIYERDPFNFEMILTRFHKFQNSIENNKENYDRTLVLKAFEVLKVSELVYLYISPLDEILILNDLFLDGRYHHARQCIGERPERVSNAQTAAVIQSNHQSR